MSTEYLEAEGFYAGYLTALNGQSTVLFVLWKGMVAGTDTGGGIYRGSYSHANFRNEIHIDLRFEIGPDGAAITIDNLNDSLELQAQFVLDLPPEPDHIYNISTSSGPVNATFEKIRGLDWTKF